MPDIRKSVRFLLNNSRVEVGDLRAGDTLLDFLRLNKRLCGTKEGCAEGDCGACTVLVGRLSAGNLVYETVNACIRFLATVDGCHVVTIEHLAAPNGDLHPVQQALVDHHASQCGFCTPGIVMSVYALWMSNLSPSETDVETALQGNLCRCTGYGPIIKAAHAASRAGGQKTDALLRERSAVISILQTLKDGARIEAGDDTNRFVLPAGVDDLAHLRARYPTSTIIAGATDVGLWVTKLMRNISPAIFIAHLEELQAIEETDTGITIGAAVTYSQLREVIARRLPQLESYWDRIGGEQVRNMGTIGGNVANGSPIGDTPPVLIALGANLTLRQGNKRRTLPAESFFIDYGKQDRQEGDFLESLHIPLPSADDHFAAYKVSKRRDEDISSVAAAFRIRCKDGLVSEAVLTYGGMAAIPKRARSVETALLGRPWSADAVAATEDAYQDDFAPISDWRASAQYRALVARKLLIRFHLETTQGADDIRLRRSSAA